VPVTTTSVVPPGVQWAPEAEISIPAPKSVNKLPLVVMPFIVIVLQSSITTPFPPLSVEVMSVNVTLSEQLIENPEPPPLVTVVLVIAKPSLSGLT